MQYKTPSIRQFFEENIEHGLEEITRQYTDVISEGERLNVKMATLEDYKKYYFAPFENKS